MPQTCSAITVADTLATVLLGRISWVESISNSTLESARKAHIYINETIRRYTGIKCMNLIVNLSEEYILKVLNRILRAIMVL